MNGYKVYSLPKVQYRSKKFKLTALEGSLIRKAIFGRFSIQEKPFYSLMTLTNQGEIILFNLDSEKQIILDKRYASAGAPWIPAPDFIWQRKKQNVMEIVHFNPYLGNKHVFATKHY